ncbi:hypothetical protein TIFTF001_042641 [Ficus carica]|uniref:Ribonuclease H1 N-terminal domain-containing protein n=1 Tax=Ficus carica TaxID=3494 RepID=A0AA87ZNN9_FICCA|nr:hypothetical protein TIFTF001_042641 [Ficus carica]
MITLCCRIKLELDLLSSEIRMNPLLGSPRDVVASKASLYSCVAEELIQLFIKSGMQHIHVGLVMIRVYGMHRRQAGVKVLVVIRDTRWGDARSIIGQMEIDLAEGTELVYFTPDIMMSVQDFYNHMEVVVKTKGYESWTGGESNLLVTVSVTFKTPNPADERNNKGNIARAAILENLELPDDWDVLSVDQDDPDSDEICSISDGEPEAFYFTKIEKAPLGKNFFFYALADGKKKGIYRSYMSLCIAKEQVEGRCRFKGFYSYGEALEYLQDRLSTIELMQMVIEELPLPKLETMSEIIDEVIQQG